MDEDMNSKRIQFINSEVDKLKELLNNHKDSLTIEQMQEILNLINKATSEILLK